MFPQGQIVGESQRRVWVYTANSSLPCRSSHSNAAGVREKNLLFAWWWCLLKRKSITRTITQSDHIVTIVKRHIKVVWTCLPFIRSGQNHLARHSERGKKTKQTEKEVGRQHQGMDRPGVCQVPEGGGGQRKMEETGCEVICGAPTTPAVKG